ncbi:MAG: Txe/YoeB family addiction module toxin [Reichenbachiella sp.]
MKRLLFSPNGWLDYISWQKTDKNVQLRIDGLTKEICLDPFSSKSQAVQLKFDLSEIWTRKIDFEHRIVYRVTSDSVHIIQCRYHF